MDMNEFANAKLGQWSDSPLVMGDPTEMGSKWLWNNPSAANSWMNQMMNAGEIDLVITQVPTTNPLPSYPSFPHPPQGTAYHVPIGDLGPASLLPPH